MAPRPQPIKWTPLTLNDRVISVAIKLVLRTFLVPPYCVVDSAWISIAHPNQIPGLTLKDPKEILLVLLCYHS